MDTMELMGVIDYRASAAAFRMRRPETALRPAGEWRELGTLELCTILRSVHREILRKTGMEPEQFIDGMRELLAPVEEA
jgi:hypothetical protein